MSFEIKKLGNQEVGKFKELIRVFEEVFEMESFKMPNTSYLQQLLEKERFFVFVALLEDKVIGGLTSYILQQYYSEMPLVYIYDLAVTTEFQRQGIGKMLISNITSYCREIGIEEVFVQADEEDDYAIEFYHSTGATAQKVVHFYYPLNTK
ncbi:MAG: GNAT family N-acetyltransferase [Segetibacter sp.]